MSIEILKIRLHEVATGIFRRVRKCPETCRRRFRRTEMSASAVALPDGVLITLMAVQHPIACDGCFMRQCVGVYRAARVGVTILITRCFVALAPAHRGHGFMPRGGASTAGARRGTRAVRVISDTVLRDALITRSSLIRRIQR